MYWIIYQICRHSLQSKALFLLTCYILRRGVHFCVDAVGWMTPLQKYAITLTINTCGRINTIVGKPHPHIKFYLNFLEIYRSCGRSYFRWSVHRIKNCKDIFKLNYKAFSFSTAMCYKMSFFSQAITVIGYHYDRESCLVKIGKCSDTAIQQDVVKRLRAWPKIYI